MVLGVPIHKHLRVIAHANWEDTDQLMPLGTSACNMAHNIANFDIFRSPLKDAGNRQGNLPLHSNRQRSSPALKELPITSPQNDPLTSSRTPG